MRQPTSFSQLYRRYLEALKSGERIGLDGELVCGWFKMKMVKGGPWVPVRIYCRQELDDFGELADDERHIMEVGPDREIRGPGFYVLTPITKAEYLERMEAAETHEWMRATHAPVDLDKEIILP